MFDYVIVGAGAAGSVLAARLTEDPGCSVALIEAGPDYADPDRLPEEIRYGFGPRGIVARSHDWGYVAHANDTAGPMPLPRGRVVGGSSAVNAQIFLHGLREDFDLWEGMGNADWSWPLVQPCFRKVETDADFPTDDHGHDGPMVIRRYPRGAWTPPQAAFYEACRDAGHPDCADHNAPGSTGAGPFPLNTRGRLRWSAALAYLQPARVRPNLTIVPEANVTHVVFRGTRAEGVELVRGGAISTICGGEVILCAGAIGSPCLLMRSGIGPEEGLTRAGVRLRVRLPGVGGNLRDHPTAPMRWELPADVTADPRVHHHQVGLRYTASGSALRNDMIVYFAVLDDPRCALIRPTVNLAAGAGAVTVASIDPHAAPVIRFDYFKEPFDRERLREAVRHCDGLMADRVFDGIHGRRTEPTDEQMATDGALDRWIQSAATTGHHASGTCRMGPDGDADAVVDGHGRVRGTDGLRVADASIMPDCVRANIHATVLMMAERVVELIGSEK